MGFPGGSEVKESACNSGGLGSIPGSGRSSGERNVHPLQCSCLKNSMDGGDRQDIVYGVVRVGHDWMTNTHRPAHTEFHLLNSINPLL